MLRLEEWLRKVGLQTNPFEFKQAEEEGMLLSAYFVEHPAFNQILDQGKPRSSVLFASRGTGKSSALRMFTTYWDERPPPRPLFVYLTDWANIIERATALDQILTRHHLEEVLRRLVVALVEQPAPSQQPQCWQPDTTEYLHWLCSTYTQYLTPPQQRVLPEWGYVAQTMPHAAAIYESEHFPISNHMRLVSALVQELGYAACYVLVDNIDELPQTVADWHACAQVLEHLIGNLRMHEVQGVAFKYFIPTEVFTILNDQKKIRQDRIRCFNLIWSDQQIMKLLCNRLAVFSQNAIHSLAPLASPDLRDIDERLSQEAGGSPRHLLNLGEWLIQACAADATDRDATIYEHHFQIAQQQYHTWLRQQRTPSSPVAETQFTPSETVIPLLSVRSDDCILRGGREVVGWQKLPSLQRKLLRYLYEHRDHACSKEDIITHVWKDKAEPASDSSLRKLIERLRQFIEPDPHNPVYIQHLTGGKYVLKNATAEDVVQ